MSALAGVLTAAGIILGKLTIPLPNRQIGEVLDFVAALFGLFFAMGIYLKQRKESGIFPEYVVNTSSVIAGMGLIWWSVELYTLAGSQAGGVHMMVCGTPTDTNTALHMVHWGRIGQARKPSAGEF